MRPQTHTALFLFAAIAASSTLASDHGLRYQFIDLGLSGPEYLSSAAGRINNQGQVIGSFVHKDEGMHQISFLFKEGQGFTDLGALLFGEPGRSALLTGITDTGVLFGPGFIYRPGRGTVFPEPTISWYPLDENRAGLVVGSGGRPDRPTFGTQAFYYTESQGTVRLGTLVASDFPSDLGDVNENGLAVGQSAIPTQDGQFVERYVAITFSLDEGMREIPIPGAVQSAATAVNDAGTIAGYFRGEGRTVPQAFLLEASGNLSLLGSLGGEGDSFAIGMNEIGHVVGISNFKAFLYRGDTGMLDLDQFRPTNSDWVQLNHASDINDRGEIVGSGLKRVLIDPETQKYEMRTAAFVLRPIPEPATGVLLAIGLSVLFARRRLWVVATGHRTLPR